MVVHTCNPSNKEAEIGGSRVPGQPELHSKTLSQKINAKQKIGEPSAVFQILCSLALLNHSYDLELQLCQCRGTDKNFLIFFSFKNSRRYIRNTTRYLLCQDE
jgi:hypothetical protein